MSAGKPSGAYGGYTVLETVVALTLLVSIAVPLISRMQRGTHLYDARRELTGIWLIEQEAATVRAFPAEALPVRRRMAGGEEWTLRTETTAERPVRYRITAELWGTVRAEACFLGRAADE